MPDQISDQTKGFDVVDVQVTDTESELFQQLFHAYNTGKLELPTMPEVAMKIIKLADDPHAKLTEIAKIIQLEPAVAGSMRVSRS